MAQTPALAQATAPGAGDTRERLLDAAEHLFGENGFDGTSMRALARAAGTGVSAANYHFGSKEALLTAVMLRRINPVNELRIQRLETLEAQAGNQPLRVEDIVDAYLRPVFEIRAASLQRDASSPWLAARVYSDPSDAVSKLKRELFVRVHAARELEIAQQLTTGLLVHVLSGNVSEGELGSAQDYEPILRRLIAYATAGLTHLPVVPADGAEEQP